MTETIQRNYKIFISGELVDLCIPDKKAIELDGWSDWFNDISTNQNTGHAIFPNFHENQLDYLEKLSNKDTIVLLVCRKVDRTAVGVVSLSQIDMISRQALWSIMIGSPEKLRPPGLAALEAVALISEHGFKELGLQKIYGGQPFPGLKGWNKLLELIGYQVDGIHRNGFRRGNIYSNCLHISCLYDDYLRIVDHRKDFWPGLQSIKKLLRKQPRKSYAEKLEDFSLQLRKEHFSFIFDK